MDTATPDGSTVRLNAEPVPGIVGVLQLASGWNHTCARINNGSVFCWGRYIETQVERFPAQLARLMGSSSIDIKAGGYVTCSRLKGSTPLTCIAQEDTYYQAVGATINNLDIVQLGVGPERLCTLKSSGAVYCWGMAPLGDGGSAEYSSTPVQVRNLSEVVEVVPGRNATCARQKSGAVSCWGVNGYGEAGTGNVGDPVPLPTQVPNLVASTVVAGDSHMCAITTSGLVKCWGDNSYGQLGIGVGVITSTGTPTLVLGLD